ncbi:hypothetical protein HK097_008056 [Rhizophlyctis rosea]|uniref:Uncharacterized protein n=1 Tax=Rhizophlyctis rosea TaxID=64517 RepID=A0AAD5SAU7_9FUNG|nr:hypothetical protein HK097_008056 [Rhizophlyctis rosea]
MSASLGLYTANPIRTFIVKSLERNLQTGRGADTVVKGVKQIGLRFGSDACPAKPALLSLYINEFPRLHSSNPSIQFQTVTDLNSACSISLQFENGKTSSIDMQSVPSSVAAWTKLLAEVAKVEGGSVTSADVAPAEVDKGDGV